MAASESEFLRISNLTLERFEQELITGKDLYSRSITENIK